MKTLIYFFLFSLLLGACAIQNPKLKNTIKEEPVVIANDSLEYEITIIDVGFTYYLESIAKPISYYSIGYLELKNKFYVSKWNERFRNGYKYKIYENLIDYQYHIHYGLEVNYKLYNYFKFVEHKYGEKF